VPLSTALVAVLGEPQTIMDVLSHLQGSPEETVAQCFLVS